VIEVSERDDAVVFAVRVTPRARRDAIEGDYQGARKVRLVAPPLESHATEGLRRLLAEHLNVPVSAVRIVGGEKSRNKRVAIAGDSPDQVVSLAEATRAQRG
jgi:uncharacterized protein (TIGR00251 family)